MKIHELKNRIIKRYMNERTRKGSMLLIGPPRIGKSTAVYEAAEEIAKRLKKKFIKMRLRWHQGKFAIVEDGMKDIFQILENPEDYFVLVDIRLSTIAPET